MQDKYTAKIGLQKAGIVKFPADSLLSGNCEIETGAVYDARCWHEVLRHLSAPKQTCHKASARWLRCAYSFKQKLALALSGTGPCQLQRLNKLYQRVVPMRHDDRRLPCSKHAVSILKLWCTLHLMQVDVDLHLNQLWDCGGQYG